MPVVPPAAAYTGYPAIGGGGYGGLPGMNSMQPPHGQYGMAPPHQQVSLKF